MKGPQNRRSLGFARDDKGEGGAPNKARLRGSQVSKARPGAPLRLHMEALPHPLSSRPGFPVTQHWTKRRMRLSLKEMRMKCAKATSLYRKSGGAPAEGSAVPRALP